MAFAALSSCVLADDGSVLNPSLGFYNWQGSGFFVKGSGGVGLAINGVEVASWASSGGANVSIADGTVNAPSFDFLSEPLMGLSKDATGSTTFSTSDASQARFIVRAVGANALSNLILQTASGSTGDNYLRFQEIGSSGTEWSLGRDKSDSSSFVLSQSSALGTNTFFKVTTSGVVSFAKSICTNRLDVASAATITALSSANTLVKLTGVTATTIQGITAGADGQHMKIINLTGANMTIANENAGATAANRITTMTGADVATTGNGAAELVYDTGSSRWICTFVTA